MKCLGREGVNVRRPDRLLDPRVRIEYKNIDEYIDEWNDMNLTNKLIPISRFNKGEAGKIFEGLAKEQYQLVVKNNSATAVIMSPEYYDELMEELDDLRLAVVAFERMASGIGETVSAEEVLARAGITPEMIAATPDIELDLE